jgi:hypothetical protein
MTDRKIFGLAMRLFGLWLAAWQGVFNLCVSIIALTDFFQTRSPADRAITGICGLIIGLILMKGEWLVRFVYGPERSDQNPN